LFELEKFICSRDIDCHTFFGVEKEFLRDEYWGEIRCYVDNGLSVLARDNLTGKIIGTICNKDLYGKDLFMPYFPHPNYLFEKTVRDEVAKRGYRAFKKEFEIDLEEELKTKPKTYVY
jgi:hypothetical protein